MDIREFIAARLDEDEDVALAVEEDPYDWRIEEASDYSGIREWRIGNDSSGGFAFAARTYDRLAADHIVRWDPPRVLREVDAKRRRLNLHRAATQVVTLESRCLVCLSDRAGRLSDDWEPDKWPCESILSDAAPYADHPDFDPAWKLADQ